MKTLFTTLIILILICPQLRSQDLDWQHLSLPASEIFFSVIKTQSGKLYTSTSNGNEQGGFFMSGNDGSTWTKLCSTSDSQYMTRLYTNDEINWVATDHMPSTDSYAMHYSRDGGNNWITAPIQSQCIALAKNSNIIGIEYEAKRLYISRNFGVNWSIIQSQSQVTVNHLDVDKNGRIWAATDGRGILVSDDNGESWTTFSPDPPSNNILFIAVSGTGRPFIMTKDCNLYFLNSAKTAWIKTDLPTMFWQNEAWDLYAGKDNILILQLLRGEGVVFISPDGGSTWINPATGNGEIVSIVYCMFIDDNSIYASTHSGIYETSIPMMSMEEASPEHSILTLIPGGFSTTSDKGGEVALFDILGRKIADWNFDEGTNRFRYPQLTAGTYILSVAAGSERFNEKVIIAE